MKLDYSKIATDASGHVEQPELMLRTLHGERIGTIHGVFGLTMSIRFAEPSEISFSVPSMIDGKPNPDYDKIT